jgi:hypothetical protein
LFRCSLLDLEIALNLEFSSDFEIFRISVLGIFFPHRAVQMFPFRQF